ncbi:exonuclease domain-containing protein [Homoserinimonas sp. OAct 916]|uniref:exonuclease domain-containing protein n=1 Tax=Homoserinimonas sp. OAct 916 TaxID=2211450 RepID=UPI000DBE35A1|nr:exonuclease domain-containing protein [Homoserinimonas sp. OAct 916]
MPSWYEKVGVFDLETTGIDTSTCRIVTAHVGVLDAAGQPIQGTDWLIDPGVEIPAQATAVHKITTEHAREHGRPPAESIAEIVAALSTLLSQGVPVVVYNAPYDLSLLAHEARRHGLPVLDSPAPIIDPLVIDKAVDRYRKGKRTLEAATAVYGVFLEDAHNAAADAIAAGRVAQALGRKYSEALEFSADELHNRQVGWSQDQAASFQEYMREKRNEPQFVASGAWPLR